MGLILYYIVSLFKVDKLKYNVGIFRNKRITLAELTVRKNVEQFWTGLIVRKKHVIIMIWIIYSRILRIIRFFIFIYNIYKVQRLSKWILFVVFLSFLTYIIYFIIQSFYPKNLQLCMF